jgi:glycosyltransferase involved in cell wall biosynthesis
MHPKISVLMPVYNAARYVGKAITSILNQDFPDFELVILDDGSSDNSMVVIKEFASKDARIKVVSRENKGISITRNELITLASADIIAWMDADDISLPHRLSTQYDFLAKHADYVALGTKTQLIDKDDDSICVWPGPSDHEAIDHWHISGRGGAIVFPSTMMRRKAAKEVGGFNPDLVGAEDLDLFLRLAEVGKLANVDPICFCYRQHIDSICHEQGGQIASDSQKAIDAATQRRGLSPVVVKASGKNLDKLGIYNKWVWWSLREGNKHTAQKYALKTVLMAPTRLAHWKALFFAWRGY